MSPDELLAEQQAAQARADSALLRELTLRYGTAWQRMRSQLEALTREIEAARARGVVIDETWLRERRIVQRLRGFTEAEVRVFIEFARRRVDRELVSRAVAGTVDAQALVDSTIPPAVRPVPLPVPLEETALILTATRPGAPLALLFDELGPDAARRATEALVEGVLLGHGPRAIAREMRDALGGNMARALRIARTETVGVYRRAALERYARNDRLLDGWVWVARLDGNVCPVCVAMHGTVHPLSEAFATHPNCRCTPAPLTRSWAELGFPGMRETRFQTETGTQWLAAQSAERQRALLGPGKYRLYREGDLALRDLVVQTQHPLWGPGRRERALRDLPILTT